jgi:hypothetical protein
MWITLQSWSLRHRFFWYHSSLSCLQCPHYYHCHSLIIIYWHTLSICHYFLSGLLYIVKFCNLKDSVRFLYWLIKLSMCFSKACVSLIYN